MSSANREVAETGIHRFSFSTDKGAGERAKLGLLVLETDMTIEAEFRDLTAFSGVTVFHSRVPCNVSVTPETLMEMKTELPKSASMLPEHLGLTALGYGCTSAATIIGEAEVADIFEQTHSGVPSTNPLSAAKAALQALGVKNLALLTPYRPDVTIAMQNRFVDAGINIVEVGSFYEESDAVVGKIDEKSILDATLALGENVDIDGVFISCTSLRAAKLIQEAEEKLNKPVTASNHALAWHMLRLAGITDTRDDLGQLFQRQLETTTE